jgi:Tfp pilus assembly protein PilN
MKHKFTFALCITVIVLTSAVVVSIALMLFERQDVETLQLRISELKQRNAALEARLRDVPPADGPAAASGSAP